MKFNFYTLNIYQWVGAVAFITLSGCNPGGLLGTDGESGPTQYVPNYSMAPPAHQASVPCGDTDPSHLCVALKYVSYQSGGQDVVTSDQATSNITSINSVWAQCQVKFFIESYVAVNPQTDNLTFQPASMDDLQTVRNTFSEGSTMLVATTGQWSGDLGSQPANAWTNLPPVGPFGAVLEQSVATYPNVIAHELGHYMNLVHVADTYNVMNPIVYSNSITISDDQCTMARATAISFWGSMLR